MRGLLTTFHRDARGTSAVEFALVLPILLTLWLGGYETTQAVRAKQKVTETTYTVVNLATQYNPSISGSQISTVLGASAQVMAPFNTNALTIVLTEYQTSVLGVSSVVWSQALNGTALIPGTIVTLPATICPVGGDVVLASVTYKYTPPIGYQLTGPITMSDSLYMSPRQTVAITYSGP